MEAGLGALLPVPLHKTVEEEEHSDRNGGQRDRGRPTLHGERGQDIDAEAIRKSVCDEKQTYAQGDKADPECDETASDEHGTAPNQGNRQAKHESRCYRTEPR